MSKNLLIVCLSLLFSLEANATIPQDEEILRVVLYCGGVLHDSRTIVYDKDRQNLAQIHKGVMFELTNKYTRNDSDLMIAKASSQSTNPKGDPATLCRNIFTSLQNMKYRFGFYLSQD